MYNMIGDIVMKTIKENKTTEYIIQKSRFITELIQVHTKEEINILLDKVKITYPGANHYCYAYIIDQEKRCSDDGEPSKTAGMPMLNVLESNDLNHILCIVIRYFGGIKLGAGGLVRAYTKAVTSALEQNSPVEMIKGYEIKLKFTYGTLKQIDYLLKNVEIIQKEFQEYITYTIHIDQEQKETILKELDSYLLDSTLGQEIYMTKEMD